MVDGLGVWKTKCANDVHKEFRFASTQNRITSSTCIYWMVLLVTDGTSALFLELSLTRKVQVLSARMSIEF